MRNQPKMRKSNAWQREHREHLKTPGGPIYYEFSTPEELRVLILSINELRELVRPRRARIPFLPMREKFTGRRQILETLQQDLTTGNARGVVQPISVYADGGVGKTALAVELGWRLFEAQQFDFVLFLNASTPETLAAELASLPAADALDLPEQTAKEQEIRLAGVVRWLGAGENARRTFLILDNADADEARQAVRNLLPKVAACAVLITSRFGGALGGVRQQELALFDAEESREYLRTHLQPGLLAASGAATLDAVSEAVDHLPLALELVVSYMHETRQSPSEWLEEWRKSPAPTLAFHDADAMNYPVSLARVWEQSVGRLSPSARDLLYSLAWMAPRPAALPLEALKVHQDWPGLRAALSELAKVSLIAWPHGTNEISIHRVLQAVTRHSMSEEETTASLKSALAQIEASLPDPEWSEEGWKLWERLASHCRTLLNHLRDHVLESKATLIMNELALWFKNRAEHGQAEPLYRRALAIFEKSFSPDHPNVATGLNNLAGLLRDTNRLAEAEPLYRRALAVDEKSFGMDHPEVATVLNDLAALLYNTNRLAEAQPLYRRALAIDEKSFGPDHPKVARVLNNLAELLRNTNRLAEAEPLSRRHLRIFVEFGHCTAHEHPHFHAAINNYAGLLSAMGLSEDAIAARVRSAIEGEPWDPA